MNEKILNNSEVKLQNIYSKIGKWYLILGVSFLLITFSIGIGDDIGLWETDLSLIWGAIVGILGSLGLFFFLQGIIFLIIGYFKKKSGKFTTSPHRIYFNISKWYFILGILFVALTFVTPIRGFAFLAIALIFQGLTFLVIGLCKRKQY